MKYSQEPLKIVQHRKWYMVELAPDFHDTRARELIMFCNEWKSDGEYSYSEQFSTDAGWATSRFFFNKAEDAVFFQLKFGA